MNRKPLISTTCFLISLCLAGPALARDGRPAEISVEVDPATFAFSGYGVHLRVSPKGCNHLLVGAGAYAMDYPGPLVDANPDNRDAGWNVRLDRGLGLFAEHHFTEVNRKWFVGSQLGTQEYAIGKEHQGGKSTFSNALLMGYGGYTWQPFDIGLYIKPWAGIGYTGRYSGSNELRGETYGLLPVVAFATLHTGYAF